ncbi:hypothetical protein EHS13_12390 [Paenibacillus psychroresistens]|uniref:Uncharacterized protein n=1 Tax=Paenibacillus psychroresistens TaxID=1778678 RepID=A0A6B8RIQ6_9BACL|nr:hypothetical protein [Paenibacillus psychroresistens]QGQ95624.1 hypothetical protein EHS13_12390 [Paenibacillus psychroresistens]
MTNQALINRLTELVGIWTANTLALAPKYILNGELDQELATLKKQVQQQLEAGQISQKQSQAALGLIAGLYLWNGNLDNSHTIAQDLENKTGSYLHGILHRMEPDYSNAKYWFHMAGGHPEFEQLREETLKLLEDSTSGNEALSQRFLLNKGWNPGLLTDLVEEALRKGAVAEEVTLLERIQALELRLLLAGVLLVI